MEKFVPQSPDKFLKKEADMTVARFGHINAIVDEQNTIADDVTTLETTVTSLSGAVSNMELEYTEFTLTSLTLLTGLSGGVTVLDSLPANQYYDIDTVILEYTYGTSPYVLSDYIVVGNYHLSSNFLVVPGNRVVVIKNPWQSINYDQRNKVMVDYGGGTASIIGSQLDIYTYTGTDATGGDGTVLVKIWYKVKTLGSEL